MRMRLRLARIEARLSQKELSLIVGVSQQTIAKWERGVTTPAQFSQIRALEKALGQPASVLFPDLFSVPEPLAE